MDQQQVESMQEQAPIGNPTPTSAEQPNMMVDESPNPNGKQGGVCKWFNTTKGFGFITPDTGGEDVFVHQTAIYARGFRSLAEGEKVEYDVVVESGRSKATNVTGPNGNFVQGTPQQRPGGGGGGGFHQGYENGGRGGSQHGNGVKCYSCGQVGHYSRDCPGGAGQQGAPYGGFMPNNMAFAPAYGAPAAGFQQPAGNGFAAPQGQAVYAQYPGGFPPQQNFDAGGYPPNNGF